MNVAGRFAHAGLYVVYRESHYRLMPTFHFFNLIPLIDTRNPIIARGRSMLVT